MCNNSGGFYITHGSRKAKAKAIVNLRFRGIIRPNRRKSERLKRISSVVISRATMNCHRDSWRAQQYQPNSLLRCGNWTTIDVLGFRIVLQRLSRAGSSRSLL